MSDNKEKTCKRCLKMKPIFQFRWYSSGNGVRGRRGTCRVCESRLRRGTMSKTGWKHGDTHKICGGCGESLPVDTHFHQQKYKPKGKRPRTRPLSQCKACHKKRSRRAFRQRQLDQLRLVFDYFRENPCVDCGEDNPALLEFDHMDESNKSFGVGSRIGAVSTAKLFKEIEKCQVRCKNCHHLRTMARHGHFAKIPEAREYLREWEENDTSFEKWGVRER